jgi:hypothetical protein
MAGQQTRYLNLLQKQLPEGLLVTSSWLIRHGYSRQLLSHYVRTGGLRQPTRGVYQRPRGSLSWQQIVISLQTVLKEPLVVGGRTALEIQSMRTTCGRRRNRSISTDPNRPHWLEKLPAKVRFIYRNSRKLFPAEADQRSFMNLIKGPKAQPSPAADAGFLVQPWGHGIGASFCPHPSGPSLSCSTSCPGERALNKRTN